ncbi:hypothetical protein JCM6882_003218 [Rhodosporidiobolus microsporus]
MLSSLRTRAPSLLLLASLSSTTSPAAAMARNVKSRNFATGPPASEAGLDLYSVRTPNGMKINVALEELKELGKPLQWTEHTLDFGKNEQKEEWFVREVNPNGRIPAIIDRDRDNQRIWESGSILLYLSKHYDTDFLLHFEDDTQETEMWSWVFFQHGGLGPMQGQAGHFLNAAPVKLPYAAKRYIEETRRLLSVYEDRLNEGDGGRDFLAGEGKGRFSYADIVSFTWARAHPFSLGLPSLTSGAHGFSFPAVQAWLDRIAARPGTARAIEGDMLSKMKSQEGWEAKAEEKARWVWDEEEGKSERKKDEL